MSDGTPTGSGHVVGRATVSGSGSSGAQDARQASSGDDGRAADQQVNRQSAAEGRSSAGGATGSATPAPSKTAPSTAETEDPAVTNETTKIQVPSAFGGQGKGGQPNKPASGTPTGSGASPGSSTGTAQVPSASQSGSQSGSPSGSQSGSQASGGQPPSTPPVPPGAPSSPGTSSAPPSGAQVSNQQTAVQPAVGAVGGPGGASTAKGSASGGNLHFSGAAAAQSNSSQGNSGQSTPGQNNPGQGNPGFGNTAPTSGAPTSGAPTSGGPVGAPISGAPASGSPLAGMSGAGDSSSGGLGKAVRSARSTIQSAAARGPRRARLQLRRVDPWSVLKFSFSVSVVMCLVFIVATIILYLVLAGMGVFDSLNEAISSLTSSPDQEAGAAGGGGGLDLSINALGVIIGSLVIGIINTVLFTAVSTIGAFVYNVCADLVGGIEVTLAERD